jgi:hypothetical protein
MNNHQKTESLAYMVWRIQQWAKAEHPLEARARVWKQKFLRMKEARNG